MLGAELPNHGPATVPVGSTSPRNEPASPSTHPPSTGTGDGEFVCFPPYLVPVIDQHPSSNGVIVQDAAGAGASISGTIVRVPGSAPVVTRFPIQEAKIQRPPLRDATLQRDRLLDWLNAKIHGRVVLVTAEAGYGKTTLLADFARRSRVRTLWYRLDEEDRDCATILHHLVAAGRQVEPSFGQATAQALSGIGEPLDRDALVRGFVTELAELATSHVALILDDYHIVEDAPDVRAMLRELLARPIDRLSIVILSRRRPTLPLARLRTLGELAELTAADLRFDLAETERLFSETYGRRLEPDLVADLNRRTEGWAASLQLVQTALRNRSRAEIRAFIRNLSGAQAELHDYLAEEVIGDLSPGMQRFLCRTALLREVVPDLAAIATGDDPAAVEGHRIEAERLGLLSPRGTSDGAQRYHPLVREHLEASARRDLPAEEIARIHIRLARHLEGTNWRLAAHHYAAAGDTEALARVLHSSTPTIMGTGDYTLAQSYLANLAERANHASADIVLSRIELQSERFESATDRAAAADRVLRGPDEALGPLALENLMAVRFMSGDLEGSIALAEQLATSNDEMLRAIGRAQRSMILASTTGSIDEEIEHLTEVARLAERDGLTHYLGISALNLAYAARARADGAAALAQSDIALDALMRSSRGPEIAAARCARAWALGHMSRWDEASAESDLALKGASGLARAEVLIESAALQAVYGEAQTADRLLTEARQKQLGSLESLWQATKAQILLRQGDPVGAMATIDAVGTDTFSPEPGLQARRRVIAAAISAAVGASDAARSARVAVHAAAEQGVVLWFWPAQVLVALSDYSRTENETIRSIGMDNPWALSVVAESICPRLSQLDLHGLRAVCDEATRRPLRWRPALRATVNDGQPAAAVAAGRILDEVGDATDVPRLRALARVSKRFASGSMLGRGLARRLARRVFVEDQGRVRIVIEETVIQGTEVRRKVLALLCLLLTRPDLSATRDHILDALWPDLEPAVAVNSLNQTVYFLRRVFEPDYSDDLSPFYIHHDSDVLWLDPELVTSRSRECRQLMRSMGANPEPSKVEQLVGTYKAPFALDFAYEEWASTYRDSLHASFLEIVEHAIQADINAGQWDRAIAIARRASETAPESDVLEVTLLRLYRLTGAHAAAAEQYEHYANMIRTDLGVEPPPLASL